MDRLSFLKALVGLPLLAALASGAQQEASSISTFVGSGSVTELQLAGQAVENAAPSGLPVGNAVAVVLDETPQAVYVSYGKDFAGDWAGYIESTDRSWVNFISKDGFTVPFVRAADGTLTRAIDKAEDVARIAAETLPKLQNNGW